MSHDTPRALFKVARSPRNVKVVQSYQALLHVCTRTHFEGRADKDTDLTSAHLSEQLFLLRVRIRRMDKCDFLGRYAALYELGSYIVVHVEIAVILRCGEVTEHKLSRFLVGIALPYTVDIFHAYVDLAALKIFKHRVYQALVKSRLAPVIGDEKHIVLVGCDLALVYLLGSLRKGLNQVLLYLARFHLYNVEVCFGGRKIEHIRRLNVGYLLEHCHQLGDIEEFCKACLCSVSRAVGGKLDCRHGFAKCRCPRVEVQEVTVAEFIVLQVFLHRVKLHHRIGNGSTRCEHATLTARQLVKVSALHIEVRGFLRFGL